MTGLDYFGARYFSGAQGRFTSPDPLLASGRPENPQTWNRYAYVSNNPLRSIDPTGLEEEKVNSTIQYGCAQGYTGANCDDPVITNPQFYAVAQGVNQAAPVVNALAVATPFVPLVAVGGAALLGLSAPTIAAAGTAGVAAAESPQGQQAVAGLLPAAQNGVQWAGQITTSVTQSATTMFRVWGGASEQAGAWLTPNMPASSGAAISKPGASGRQHCTVCFPGGGTGWDADSIWDSGTAIRASGRWRPGAPPAILATCKFRRWSALPVKRQDGIFGSERTT